MFTTIFAVIGVVLLFIIGIFYFTTWQTEDFEIHIPLYKNDKTIYNRVYNIQTFLDFSLLHKKCTIVLDNHGADEEECEKVLKFFETEHFRMEIIEASNENVQ